MAVLLICDIPRKVVCTEGHENPLPVMKLVLAIAMQLPLPGHSYELSDEGHILLADESSSQAGLFVRLHVLAPHAAQIHGVHLLGIHAMKTPR